MTIQNHFIRGACARKGEEKEISLLFPLSLSPPRIRVRVRARGRFLFPLSSFSPAHARVCAQGRGGKFLLPPLLHARMGREEEGKSSSPHSHPFRLLSSLSSSAIFSLLAMHFSPSTTSIEQSSLCPRLKFLYRFCRFDPCFD